VSKFTVIEGGGQRPPDRHAGAARYHFQQAIIEILRALARGYDAENRISAHLSEFLRHTAKADASFEAIVGDAIAESNKEIDHREAGHFSEQESETIVLRALQVAAEAIATDPAAKGRLSRRRSELRSAIEAQAIRRERRARELRQSRPKTPEESRAAYNEAMSRFLRGGRKRKLKKPPPDDEIIL
jgi:hypothetical protein